MKKSHSIINIYNQYLPLITGILFIFLLLTNPVNSNFLVNTGLTTWYKHMIPSLFPFMVLSGVLLRSGLSRQLSSLINPVLGKIFRLSPNCIYVIIMGFLCGFPMGASIVADSLSLKKITKREAELLLAFCNNIGPIYFLSFATAACPYYPIFITMPIMYGVPFIYGLILRYTIFRDIPKYGSHANHRSHNNISKKKETTYSINYAGTKNNFVPSTIHASNYLTAFEESTRKALTSIITLGGYMIIFNVLQLPLYNTFYQLPDNILCIFKGLIEINSGIAAITNHPQLYLITYAIFLPFGGICCIFQTYAMIKDTPLSLCFYLFHKIVQTLGTIFLYMVVNFALTAL